LSEDGTLGTRTNTLTIQKHAKKKVCKSPFIKYWEQPSRATQAVGEADIPITKFNKQFTLNMCGVPRKPTMTASATDRTQAGGQRRAPLMPSDVLPAATALSAYSICTSLPDGEKVVSEKL